MKKTWLTLVTGNRIYVEQSFEDFVTINLNKDGIFKTKAINVRLPIEGAIKKVVVFTDHIVAVEEN